MSRWLIFSKIFRFLRAFAELRKATLSFVMSVRPSAWNNSTPTGRAVLKFDIWAFFENMSRKFKFHSNRTRITVLHVKTNVHFWSYRVHFFLEWEMFWTTIVEKIKIHFLCSITFFEIYAVCEVMWKNNVELVRPLMTVWRMRIACWIPKATNTH